MGSIFVPALSVVDNADGSGAVATISGSTPGTTNTVYVADWPGQAWAQGGQLTGDGTVALSSAVGPHWAAVLSQSAAAAAVSLMVQFRVTDGTQAVFYRCLAAVRDTIAGLGLAGIGPADIMLWKVPWVSRLAQFPGIAVTPAPERVLPVEAQRDDVEYGVNVAMARKSNQDLTDSGAVLLWREQISRALRYRPLAGVPEVYIVRVEPGPVFWEPAFLAQHDVGSLLIRCVAREPRMVI